MEKGILMKIVLALTTNTAESMIYSALILFYLKLKMPLQPHKKTIFLLITVSSATFVSICNFSNFNSISTQLLLLSFDTAVTIFLFQNSLSQKIFVSIIPSFISIMSSKITFCIEKYMLSDYLNFCDIFKNHRLFATFLYLCSCIFLSLVILKLFHHDIFLPTIFQFSIYILIVIGIICSNFFLDIVIYFHSLHLSNDVELRINFVDISFLLGFFLVLILFWQIGQTYRKNLLLEDKLNFEQINKRQLTFCLQSAENLRYWKHDYKNHLITLTELIRKEQYSKLNNYINLLQKELPERFLTVTTGNSAIDAIVTNKLMIAVRHQISFPYSILLPTTLPLSDVELTATLGNLLDNALEACLKITNSSTSRFVKLTIKPFRNMLQIQVVNSSDGSYCLCEYNHLKTTKNDPNNHGYGIKHINNIIKSANGLIRFQPEKDLFTVNILIPLMNEKEIIEK